MANTAHNKSSATFELTSDVNKDFYIHTKYTSTLGESISEPTKVRVLNMKFDATKNSPSDLFDYINAAMEGKWQDGSTYKPSTSLFDIREPYVCITFHFASKPSYQWNLLIHTQDLNNNPPNLNIFYTTNSSDNLRFDTTLVRYAPGIIQYRSVPQAASLPTIRTMDGLALQLDGYNANKSVRYDNHIEINNINFVNGEFIAANNKYPTHGLVVRINTDFSIDWYLIANKTTF